MNYVNLPSGTMINLDLVAYMKPKPDGTIVLFFAVQGAPAASLQQVPLGKKGAKALVAALGSKGIDVSALKAALTPAGTSPATLNDDPEP